MILKQCYLKWVSGLSWSVEKYINNLYRLRYLIYFPINKYCSEIVVTSFLLNLFDLAITSIKQYEAENSYQTVKLREDQNILIMTRWIIYCPYIYNFMNMGTLLYNTTKKERNIWNESNTFNYLEMNVTMTDKEGI